MKEILNEIKSVIYNTPERQAVRQYLSALSATPSQAIEIADYRRLGQRWQFVEGRLHSVRAQRIGILCQKKLECYAAVLGVLSTGNCFVPLNPNFPVSRLAEMIQLAEINLVFLSTAEYDLGQQLLRQVAGLELIVVEGSALDLIEPGEPWLTADTDSDASAYVIFTSGSTGKPKGIDVSRKALEVSLNNLLGVISIEPGDRFSQVFDLSFDVSLGEIFWALRSGSCLCPLEQRDIVSIAGYFEANQISIWGSTPSFINYALMLLRGGKRRKVVSDTIRFSLLVGEKLQFELAKSWSAFAVQSRIDNFYGPAEATLYVSHHTCRLAQDSGSAELSLPIGKAWAQAKMMIVNDELEPVDLNEVGEILISGPQLAKGYIKDPERTAQQFVYPAWDRRNRWYRTGDLGRREVSLGRDENYIIGRRDSQVKILGQRFEPQDLESLLRACNSTPVWIAVAHPIDTAGYFQGVVVVLTETLSRAELQVIHSRICEKLPKPFVPTRFLFSSEVPLNASGKLDRDRAALLVRQGSLRLLWP